MSRRYCFLRYVEADDLQASLDAMARTDVNARWQAEMAPFFVGLNGGGPGRGPGRHPDLHAPAAPGHLRRRQHHPTSR